MLVSVTQQSESAMCIYMPPYPLPLGPLSPPPYPTPLGHRKAPSWFPVLCCCFPPADYFTFGRVYMSTLLSLRPSFALPPLVLKSIFYVYFFFFNLLLFYLFWLHWVFVAAHGLSLGAASGGYSSLWCVGFSLWWLLVAEHRSRHAGFSSGVWAQ